MPYYGDYYRGDYYRGDPFLGAIGGIVGGLAKKALPAIARGVGLLKRKAPAIAAKAGQILRPTGAAATVALSRPLVPAKSVAKLRAELPMVQGEDGVFRLGRRRRRMNVTNVKALRRAGRRVRGFLKLARRFGALPISPKGKKLFRARRRSK